MAKPVPPAPCIYLVASRFLIPDGFLAAVEAALRAGVDIVQMREKEGSASELRELGRRLRILTEQYDAAFVVNDDPDLAVALGADGVHVGRDDMPVERARDIVGPDRWVGLSTHDVDQVHAARQADVDMIGFGPVFSTTTKDAGVPRGRDGLASAVKAAGDLPLFAIGGIDATGIVDVIAAGCRRVAVSSFILASDDPAARVAELRVRPESNSPS